jgi:membrane fusion protein, copper/silver efflux system
MRRLTTFFSRRRAAIIAGGIIFITLATLLALAFLPVLRETYVARRIRFWEKPPAPAPAVPPGQLGVEMEQAGDASGAITIDPDTAAALGLQTAAAEPGATAETLRTTGRVTPDERRVTQVFTKVDGWIEQTFGNFAGQQISRGQPLFTYYSPDLVATQQEYLIALKARQDFGKSEFEMVRESGAELLAATRRRLQLWDVTPQQIAEIERTGKVLKNLTFYAPASGVITERKAFPGMRVMPDTALYTLADLSVIWVEADVFETDLAKISVGTLGEVSMPDGQMMTAGAQAVGGRIAYINPFVDPQTRTAKVRLEFANPGLRLKPGMFVNVSLRAKQQPQLVVPRDAVLDTGVRKLVLVDEGNNRFALREITATLGQDVYTVQSGLKAGERVARNIQFLVDSETGLRQAVERQGGASSSSSSSSAGAGGANSPGAAASPAMPNMPGMTGGGGRQ